MHCPRVLAVYAPLQVEQKSVTEQTTQLAGEQEMQEPLPVTVKPGAH